MTAKELATGSLPLLSLSDTIHYALQRMDEYSVPLLPVAGQSGYLGMVAEKECADAPFHDHLIQEAGVSLMQVSVNEHDHVFHVLDLLMERNLMTLPVVDAENRYLGSITPMNLLHGMGALLSVNQPGGIIQLEIPEREFLLSEIVQIAESNDTRIINFTVNPVPDSVVLMVNIKMNRLDIGPVLQTLNRYNYNVKGSWSNEDSYSANLSERFDALMNYLNI
jgi:predicted transcriptional regulator